jgi:hypothetical protein
VARDRATPFRGRQWCLCCNRTGRRVSVLWKSPGDDRFLSWQHAATNRLRLPIPDLARPGVLSSAPPSWRIGVLRIQSRAFPQAKRMHCGHTNEKSGGSNSSKMAAISIWPTLFRISRPISFGGMRMPNRKYRRPLPMDALPIRSSDVPLFSGVIGWRS